MHCLSKPVGRFAVTVLAAAVFLASTSHSTRSSPAGFSEPQDAAKVEVRKEAIPAQGKVVEKAAKVAAPGLIIERVNGANAAQMIPQLVPILRMELRLLTSAADPTPAQRREIAIEGGRTLKEVAGNIGGVKRVINQNGRVVRSVIDPRKLIHESIEAASKARLSKEQFARYQKEMERKASDRREAVLLNLVVNLDKLLNLSAEQRTKLCDSLRSSWDDAAYPSLQTIVLYNAYFPIIPDQHIKPILTEDQQKIWQNAVKINFAQIRNNNFSNNGQANGPADDDDDPDLKAALEEVKK